jgi:hypothetical protein
MTHYHPPYEDPVPLSEWTPERNRMWQEAARRRMALRRAIRAEHPSLMPALLDMNEPTLLALAAILSITVTA